MCSPSTVRYNRQWVETTHDQGVEAVWDDKKTRHPGYDGKKLFPHRRVRHLEADRAHIVQTKRYVGTHGKVVTDVNCKALSGACTGISEYDTIEIICLKVCSTTMIGICESREDPQVWFKSFRNFIVNIEANDIFGHGEGGECHGDRGEGVPEAQAEHDFVVNRGEFTGGAEDNGDDEQRTCRGKGARGYEGGLGMTR